MIRETFIHIPGIGRKTELRLWHSGIFDWVDLRETRLGNRPEVIRTIEASEDAFRRKDMEYFFSLLPASDRWRLFIDFGSHFVPVDIETTGLSIYDILTLVGIETDGEYHAFIEGSNLEDTVAVLESASGLITFNGSLFDLPFLRRAFPMIRFPSAHLDLRFLGRRAGFRGSLKQVERGAGLRRPHEIEELGGHEATVLWNQFEQGDLNALELLIKYNAADTCVLRPLCRIIVQQLLEKLANEMQAGAQQEGLFNVWRERLLHYGVDTPIKVTAPTVVVHGDSVIINGSMIGLPERSRRAPEITIDTLLCQMKDPESRVVGIDLSGSEERPTGWALLEAGLVVSANLSTTDEILRRTFACKPGLVSIDSPLTIPEGRDCTSDECACRKYGISRSCERELRRRGIGVYWCLLPSMQGLTRRGMEIANELRSAGIKVIESYPGAAQDIMGIPRKRVSQDQLKAGLESFGVKGIRATELIRHDELDAITSALVGVFYLADMYEALGSDSEGYLIIPVMGEYTPSAEASLLERPAGVKSLLLLLTGEGASEASNHVVHQSATFCVTSLKEAAQRLRAGQSSVMIFSEPSSYELALASFGPRARCILVARGDARRLRNVTPFYDLILDVDLPNWKSDLSTWLERFGETGEERCH